MIESRTWCDICAGVGEVMILHVDWDIICLIMFFSINQKIIKQKFNRVDNDTCRLLGERWSCVMLGHYWSASGGCDMVAACWTNRYLAWNGKKKDGIDI